MKSLHSHAESWILKAQSDLDTIKLLLDNNGPLDVASYHCQQAVEKALKSILAINGSRIPKTHDLDELQSECLKVYDLSQLSSLDFAGLTEFGVGARYDFEFCPTKDEVYEAYKIANKAVEIAKGVSDSKR